MNKLSIKSMGLSLGVLFAATYLLCVVWDLAFPDMAMYQTWQALFPGFGWTAAGLLIALAETILYGFYAAAVFVPVYNRLSRREAETG